MKKYKLLTQNGYPEYKFIKGNTYSGDFWYNNEGFRVEEMYSEYPGDWELVEEEFVLPEEIVGWKLKDEYLKYKDAAACVGNYNPIYDVQSEYIKDSDKNFDGKSIIPKLKQAGVLDLWFEPVYKKEETFCVGEWVTFYSEIDKCVYTDKIKEWTSHSYCKLENGLEPFKHLLRKATPEEIKAAQTPQITINGYVGEFFDDYVKFGCAYIDKVIILSIYNFFKELSRTEKASPASNKEIESVTIGKGTFTKEQIKQIAEFYLNKNK